MLKKYSELTEEQQKKVGLMYSDKDTVGMYLYNFDEHGDYHGRQYAPPSGKDEKMGVFGTIHAESTVLDKEETKEVEEVKEEVKEDKPKSRRHKK